ncbi:MAG TPA: ATP-binding protein, partial [Woeseiaceae bacterium]|nr:ATP-binding protein [Woeseiaceae bacterium]
MLKRFVISVLAMLAIAAATIVTWQILKSTHDAQRARIAESESGAARSQLIRNVDMMLHALRNVHLYWSRYAHLPREQRAAETGIDLVYFDGVEMILWRDAARGVNYIRTSEHPEFDYRPTEEEWAAAQEMLARSEGVHDEAILGPFMGEDGRPRYEVHLVGEEGVLVAVIDAWTSFDAMLRDVSPGYSISVWWDEVLLYRRGEPAGGVAESHSHAGMIRTSMGNLWKVIHTPTEDFALSTKAPALTAVLYTGLAIAALVGLLLFENGRARSRAHAAEVAEEQLAELNRNLEEQIAERTKELAARSADLGTITDSVAHDLRNPLNSISVNTQLLEQQYGRVLGEDGVTALQRTSSGVKRMAEILDRLLGLSIISHATFRRERVNLKEMVTDIFEELSASEPPPPVHFEISDLPEADADPTLVRTLIMNLLGNALKYTRYKDDRRIDVGFEMQDGVPVYCVRDNGIGFDCEGESRMFRAFDRLGRDGGSEEGLGLGLNIAV